MLTQAQALCSRKLYLDIDLDYWGGASLGIVRYFLVILTRFRIRSFGFLFQSLQFELIRWVRFSEEGWDVGRGIFELVFVGFRECFLYFVCFFCVFLNLSWSSCLNILRIIVSTLETTFLTYLSFDFCVFFVKISFVIERG
jgi:hypothetical protein